jgi:hypothetical protein
MCSAQQAGSVLLATAALLLLPQLVSSVSVVVQNGFEFHAALTSPNVSWILLADNVSVCCSCQKPALGLSNLPAPASVCCCVLKQHSSSLAASSLMTEWFSFH